MKRENAAMASPTVACSRTIKPTAPKLVRPPRSARRKPKSSAPDASADNSSKRRRPATAIGVSGLSRQASGSRTLRIICLGSSPTDRATSG
ncbi:hypothetical protein XH94_29955 [Bradyrhizobium zhanjiangense]|uniref:Uncharacterized protein n=1 Tax=Bradyrhizobium zhanjiangense TaxID=1325107 RepID=A0A4V1L2R1_9BRAD|nr:hypothetical protein XH94_29955 [Bradyrhizobium zhanjiangense]